ncbi:MAG: hypothetical protein AAF658_14075 [Myxococcota bacterium]
MNDVILYFERLVKQSPYFMDRSARPIAFDLLGDFYTLDPKGNGGFFKKGLLGEPALTLRCSAEVLKNLLCTPRYTPPFESIAWEGDLDALVPLGRALSSKQTALTVRGNPQGNRSHA